jgi:hypothetical protein
VADALDAGDEAGARAAADTLVADIDAAIEAGAVPDALRADLVAGVARLMVALPEVQPPPPPKKPEKGHGKKKKHDKDKG